METLKFTARIMAKRPLRSLLTILQMGLGVWIVAIILSLNFQATGALGGIRQTLGDSLAKVSVSQYEEFDDGAMMINSVSNLRVSDLAKLEESEEIESAFIFQSQWERNIVVDGVAYRVLNSAEATAGYAKGLELHLLEGQSFTVTDQEQQNRVVLISEVIAKQLFPNQSAVGRTIQLGEMGESLVDYEVIGVYEPPSPLLGYFVPQANLIFPIGTTQPAWVSDEQEQLYMEVFIRSKPGRVYEAVADTQVLLPERSMGGMEIRGEYFMDSTRYLSEQINMITLFLGAFAFISILISAIGILSIMLVSVVERTREIGLRKALGASKGLIVRQVLNESLVFSILGALLGLLAAVPTAENLITMLMQEITYPRLTDLGGLHPQAAMLSFLAALVLGQVFGFYPALQAAKLMPVDALREG